MVAPWLLGSPFVLHSIALPAVHRDRQERGSGEVRHRMGFFLALPADGQQQQQNQHVLAQVVCTIKVFRDGSLSWCVEGGSQCAV